MVVFVWKYVYSIRCVYPGIKVQDPLVKLRRSDTFIGAIANISILRSLLLLSMLITLA